MRKAYRPEKETSVRRALRYAQYRDRAQIVIVFALVITIPLTSTAFIQQGIGPANEVSCFVHDVENPTFEEMILFVAIDQTDKKPYTKTYVCHHFTHDLIAGARERDIQAGYVTLYNKPNGHAIVAFQTVDRGLYFVEPQSDNIITEEEMEQMVEQQCYRSDPQNPEGITFTRYGINWFYGK